MINNVPDRPTKTEAPLRLSEEDKYELENNLFNTRRENSIPPLLKRKNSDTTLRLESNDMENNLFAANELSGREPIDIKNSIESEIQTYAINQEIYENYKAALKEKILTLVRSLAGNDQFTPEDLPAYKEILMSQNELVFEKNQNFKKFINGVFDFYSKPENLGTTENVREDMFLSSDYNIEGGSKARKTKQTKQTKRKPKKKSTRKHRK
jgi:hypothetical protein